MQRMPQGLLGVAQGHGEKAFIRIFLLILALVACASAERPSRVLMESRYAAAGIPQSRNRLTISPTNLSSGTVSTAYTTTLTASGGTAPYQFAVSGGTLPPGLLLSSAGKLSGTPSTSGSFSFSVNVTGSGKNERGSATISISITKAASLPVSVAISPTTVSTSSGSKQQFAATVKNTSNTAVTWSASSGTISSAGLFTAPNVTTTTSVTVKATSAADTAVSAQAIVTVNPPAAVTISVSPASSSLTASSKQQFSALVTNTSNTSVTWSASTGSISSGGLFTAPAVTSSTSATVTATSVADPTKHAQASVVVNPASVTPIPQTSAGPDNTYCDTGDVANFGSSDGPATLPQACVNTALANTPSNGNVTTLQAGGNLQTALNNLACGDTLQLQAGATFTGVFVFPAKNCDNAHWITIRTSAPDASLPPEGTRVTPCYAGVTSLPGRPAFNCGSVGAFLARVVMSPMEGSGPIQFASGANHYRLMGLEITRSVGTGVVYNLISFQHSATADHIILDRVWVHGTAHDDTTRGIELGGSMYLGVVDSFFTDFHCTSVTGSCTDAQTLGGGLGSLPMGPYKVVNNFLESSGENILFGGGPATLTPADIEIRRNHFFKPFTWKLGQPGFVGGVSGNPFIVKNHFELKNAQRVLLEGNILENTWGGFSQTGYSVLLTPKNQSGLCAACQVTDVTVRYSTISHVAGGFQIANALSDSGYPALAGHSYSIHDVTVDDIQAAAYDGPGVFALVSTVTPLLHNLTINHVTAFPSNSLMFVGDISGSRMSNFVFTNNVLTTGRYPIWTTGGGTANCAYTDVPLTTITTCFSPVTFTNNAFITGSSSQWPTGNWFTSSASTVQFANFSAGTGGDYTLLSTSPYATAGTDGKPLGADISGIASATLGVY